ncbi:ABC transporter ATP-binding protein, partial [Exiguobacterium sp. UBA6309]
MHVQHVRFNYPKSPDLLHDVSFSLVPGKLNVLIGMNGAGKTTLFDCMTGALPITSGGLDLPDISDILYLTQFIYYSDEL